MSAEFSRSARKVAGAGFSKGAEKRVGTGASRSAVGSVCASFSKGAEKLAGAAEALGVDFRKKIVLDVGSSTGGFTEVALSLGAKKVIAVEKGSKQMREPLKSDARVELHEKTDVFLMDKISGVDLVVADVSFVSIRKILKAKALSRCEEFLVMVKPQFEARKEELNRGVVKNEKMRRRILRDFEEWARGEGLVILGKHDNETIGRKGNRERFYWMRREEKPF